MRALLLSEYKKLSVVEMPVPAIAEDEVLIRVKACGVCGSDVHGYDGSTGRRIPPLVMGHEAAGVIERVGSRVARFTAGDRVTFDSMVSCGACDFCRRGQMNLCDNHMVLGVSCGDYRRHGAFAEYVSVPERILYTRARAAAWGKLSRGAGARGRRPRDHQQDARGYSRFRPKSSHYPRIDILVNNAGCNVRKAAVDVTWQDWNLGCTAAAPNTTVTVAAAASARYSVHRLTCGRERNEGRSHHASAWTRGWQSFGKSSSQLQS